jgi:hypothetical protein
MVTCSVDDALERRIKQLQRAYRRQLRTTKATTIQQQLIDRASRLTGIAEAMSLDPNCKHSHLVLMDNRAQAARVEMFASFTNGRNPEQPALTLGELLRHGA